MWRSLVAILVLSCTARSAEVRVFAAASLTDALTEIASTYERRSGDDIVFNFAASSVLARQIENGAPADLFLSADEEKVNALAVRGLVASRATVLSNQLVVVQSERTTTIASPQDLVRVPSLALAEPSSVPAGIYARTWLERIGLWDDVAKKVVPTENVRGALAAVASGNIDAAIVYRTDARIEPRARVAFAIDDGPPISYPFALLSDAGPPARRFFEYLQSKEARDVFARHGFIVR